MKLQHHFADEMQSVSDARSWVGQLCRSLGCGDVCATMQLVIDELVTNAFVHAQTSATVTIWLVDGVLHGAVRDFGGGEVRRRESVGPDQIGGWGLQLVEGLTTEWRVDYHSIGKTVTFSVACPAPTDSGP